MLANIVSVYASTLTVDRKIHVKNSGFKLIINKLKRRQMEKSKSIAGIVGPTLIVMVLSELKVWNASLYDTQIVPLVYLSGVLIFVAGLSIVRRHNVWAWGWQTLITIIGWLGLILGILRMFFPQMYSAKFRNDSFAFAIELILIFIGIILTVKAYLPTKKL